MFHDCFFLYEERRGRRGIKLALLFADVWGFGAGTRLSGTCAILEWANYGEMLGLFCLITLLLANSFGKMSKRPLGMNHYKRGGRRNKNTDYLLDHRYVEGLPY